MKLREIYDSNPSLFGSPRLIAFFEALARVPHKQRVAYPALGEISITSDGFIISNGSFYGDVSDLENNLKGLCHTFDADISEVKELMNNTTDWRPGGNAYS